MAPQTNEHALAAALDLAQRGFHVFPLVGSKPKHADWYFRATTDPEQIREWFSSGQLNVGVKTGAEAGVVVVSACGDSGWQAARQLELDRLATLVCKHGNATDYYFTIPAGDEIRTHCGRSTDLDLKAARSFAVGPGSVDGDGAVSIFVDPNQKPAPLPRELRREITGPYNAVCGESSFPGLEGLSRHDLDSDSGFILDMRAAGRMSLQVPGFWIEEWVDARCGPRSWYPQGWYSFPVTSIHDLIEWWGSNNFQQFVRYVEERTTKRRRKWSNEKWFIANRHLLDR